LRKHKHPSPSPCSSPQRRGDPRTTFGAFGISLHCPSFFQRKSTIFSPLLRGEVERSEGEGVRWLLCALFVVFLSACSQGESEAKEPAPPLNCEGVFEQGGAAVCTGIPNSALVIDGTLVPTNYEGKAIIGFDRDAPSIVNVGYANVASWFKISLNIKPREYAISRIDGLPPSQVSTFSEAQLKRIRASSARKKLGFASRQQMLWFEDGFDYPLKQFTKTSPFGAQRILNGEAKKPHYGVDIAAPVGTPIYAPADGVVSMADDDLYFEGAMILLDHGQGLISMYLHVSAIDVKPGQEVKRGEKIGEVGSKGRSTGPHLCWRLKWRNRHLDPELLTQWPTEEHTHD